MDINSIKILVLEKLFDETIPKLINFNRLLIPEQDSYAIGQTNDAEHLDNITYFNLNFFINDLGTFKCCRINISTQRRIRVNAHQRALLRIMGNNAVNIERELEPVELENFSEDFENKKAAINKICEKLSIKSILQLGMTVITEIEHLENPVNLHIGAIRRILDLPSNIDIANLEKRDVLLEKLK